MKKVWLLSLMCLTPVFSYAATVRIKNESNAPVWARIRDQKRIGVTENWHQRVKTALGVTGALIATLPLIPMTGGIAGLGIAPAQIAFAVDMIRNKDLLFMKVPSFRKIKPDGLEYFDSGPKRIDKITFLRVKEWQTVTTPRKDIISRVNALGKEYGNIVAYKGKSRIKQIDPKKDIPVIILEDEYGKSIAIPAVAPDTEMITLQLPVFETFTIDPKVGALKTEARVIYEGWGNAYRKKKVKGIQKIQ